LLFCLGGGVNYVICYFSESVLSTHNDFSLLTTVMSVLFGNGRCL